MKTDTQRCKFCECAAGIFWRKPSRLVDVRWRGGRRRIQCVKKTARQQRFGERGSEICQNLVCRVLVRSTLKCRVSLSVILI